MIVNLSKKAQKDLLKLDINLRKVIALAIKQLENYPNVSNIKQLTNFEPPFRKRIGDYRILFAIENDCIIVSRVLHRKEAY